jgi:hypothetical protein
MSLSKSLVPCSADKYVDRMAGCRKTLCSNSKNGERLTHDRKNHQEPNLAQKRPPRLHPQERCCQGNHPGPPSSARDPAHASTDLEAPCAATKLEHANICAMDA